MKRKRLRFYVDFYSFSEQGNVEISIFRLDTIW